jgi:hypothetical protein
MADRRQKDVNWYVASERGDVLTWEQASVAVLMDIRDELKMIRVAVQGTNNVLNCQNFLEVPRILRTIRANTRKAKKKKPLKLVRSA